MRKVLMRALHRQNALTAVDDDDADAFDYVDKTEVGGRGDSGAGVRAEAGDVGTASMTPAEGRGDNGRNKEDETSISAAAAAAAHSLKSYLTQQHAQAQARTHAQLSDPSVLALIQVTNHSTRFCSRLYFCEFLCPQGNCIDHIHLFPFCCFPQLISRGRRYVDFMDFSLLYLEIEDNLEECKHR
jgi:hypothetical protein